MRARRVVRTSAALAGVALVLASGATAQLASSAPARATALFASGPLLLQEDFTGDTAIPEFSAYGDACLTGAPAGAALPAGLHPLAGCPAGGSGVSPPLGGAPDGFLRLTDAVVNQAGAVLFKTDIRSTDGVEITFEQWQYGGFSTIPQFPTQTADGISFFLVDAAQVTTLSAPGAFGGSLGYAQKLDGGTLFNGVDGGYLGFGFDVLGNFFNDGENRGSGCGQPGPFVDGLTSPVGSALVAPAPGANNVTVRGPGQGAAGYCYLGISADLAGGSWVSRLPGPLHGPTTVVSQSDPAQAVTDLLPSRRTVTMVLEPEPSHHITVYVDTGSGPVMVLDILAPQPVPPAVKFGFAASTGAFTDVHLIRTLTMQALDPLPALGLTKTATPVVPGALGVGDQVRFDLVVTNTGGGTVHGITVDAPVIGPVSCPQADLAEGASMTCSVIYTLTQADIDRGSVLSTAVANGTGRDGGVVSNPADALVELAELAASGVDGAVLGAVGAASGAAVLLGAVLFARARRRPRSE
ncbi:DUF7507 domain-containing protein [Protaetiibacter larvae]|uniref:DUF7507 domain-containing protein n=1 Tax=Protaetiibacter larvae TaxID=2592654 RepID=A0A5C1Y5S0_9MICO|nr:hypothetical protein [Protaetiibacter larvae]QEO09244.1 hypothetical protein FLP23_03980 [Protaetiibacter larvae]